MTMTITADADKSFSIEAAVARLAKPAFRLLHAAGIETPKAKIEVGALDLQLASSKLNAEQRIELKLSLSRAGLLSE